MSKRHQKIYKIAAMGIFAALSIILVYFIHLPIFPAVSFLEYDPADIPIIICSYIYGTGYGLLLTVIVSVVQGMTVSAGSGWIGILMHIFATGSLVLVGSGFRSIIFSRRKKAGTLQNAKRTGLIDAVSVIAGVAAMTVSMALWNLLFTPIFMGVTLDVVLPLMPFIVLFNIVKASINSVIALAVYRLIPHRVYDKIR